MSNSNNNSKSDKAFLYFFLGSMVLGLLMCLAFVIKTQIDETVKESSVVQITEERTIEEVAPQAHNVIYKDASVELTELFAQELNTTEIISYTNNSEISAEFLANEAAYVITSSPIEAFDNDPAIISFELSNEASNAYIYLHKSTKDFIAKTKAYKIKERKNNANKTEVLG